MSRVRARPLHGRVKKIQFFEDFFNTLEAISYTHFVAKDSDSDSKIEELCFFRHEASSRVESAV